MAATTARNVSPERSNKGVVPSTGSLDSATLRHRLQKLGYKEALPEGAISLVERLLADLLVTTETCRKLKEDSVKEISGPGAALRQIESLRNEISRLTAENNHLHRDLVRLADERDERDRRTAQMTRRLETQSADLRFVASQYAHRVEAEQKKVETVKRKAEEVFIKFGVFKERTGDGDVTFDVSGTDGRVKPRPRATTAPVPKGHAPPNEQTAEEVYERIQKFDIETGLEPQDNDAAHIPAFPYPDPVVADLVALSEKRIQALLKEMELVSAKNGELETELDVLRKQMISRNQEIARLGTQLEIACAQQFSSVQFKSTAGATNAKQHVIQDLDAARQRIAQLEAQSDLFHEHVEALEKEIAAHEDDKKALYKSFETEKKDILAQLQKERQRFSAPLPRSPSPNKAARNSKTDREDLRSSLRSPTKGATIDSVMGSTRTVNSEASGVGSLRAELEALRAENERLQASLSATARPEAVDQFANNPPSSSTATAAVTTAAEKLHAELGKLKIENATLKGRASELEAQKWALENDLKGMKHKLERAHALEKDLEATRARAQDFQRKAQDRLAECEPLRESLARAVYEQKESTERLNQLQQQYQTVSHERDELIVVLQHFEEQLSEVQRCIEAVTNDRDNIAALYEQVNEELQLFRRIHPADLSTPVGQQPPPRPTAPPEPSAPTMSPVRNTAADVAQSTGNENADLRAAQATIQHLQGEIEILQRDLQATVVRHREGGESTSDAVQRLEDEVDRLRRELRAREGERDAIKSQWQDAQRNAEAAQRAVADLQREEAALRMDIVDLKANEDREAYTARGLRSKVADMEARLARSTTECERFCKESETKTRQIQEQKALFMEIDRQRDRDRDEMDRKCERIVELEQLVEKAEAAAVNAQQEADTLHDQIQSMKEHLNEREGQISVLRQNLNKATQDRDRWAAECKRLTEEASNVGSDLGAVSKENQRLNALLEETTNERERFKAELMESESQIKQLDDLLLAKDQEREHLMAAYRKLVGEHERLDTSVKMAGEESSNMRMEMVVRDKRVMALQQALDETSADLTKAKLDLAAHEKQAANAARALAANARNVANLQADKARLVRDVAASRDLAASIDRQRDDLQKRLTAAALDVERLSKALQKADTDRETLQAEMQAEKVKAERLEHLVAVERTRKIQTEKAAQDFTKSKESLEDQLNRVNQQQKISIQAMTREIKDLEVERDHWKERVQQTERSLREQQKTLEDVKEQCEKLQADSSNLRQELSTKQKIIEDLTRLHDESDSLRRDATPVGGTKSQLEDRIVRELENTKKQLRKYEAQIAVRYSEPHTPAAARSFRTGNQLDAKNDDQPNYKTPQQRYVSEGVASSSDNGATTEDDAIVEGLLAKLKADAQRPKPAQESSAGAPTASHTRRRSTQKISPPATIASSSPIKKQDNVVPHSRERTTQSVPRRDADQTPAASSSGTRQRTAVPSTAPPTRHKTPTSRQDAGEQAPVPATAPHRNVRNRDLASESSSKPHSRAGSAPVFQSTVLEENWRLMETIVQVTDAFTPPS